MKLTVILTLLLTMTSAFGRESNQADYVVEAGTLLLPGKAAADLFESLNAKESLNPLSTRYQEIRIKKNKFAKCIAEFEREDTLEDFVLTKANCQIIAPAGTVLKN